MHEGMVAGGLLGLHEGRVVGRLLGLFFKGMIVGRLLGHIDGVNVNGHMGVVSEGNSDDLNDGE